MSIFQSFKLVQKIIFEKVGFVSLQILPAGSASGSRMLSAAAAADTSHRTKKLFRNTLHMFVLQHHLYHKCL
jgi:hypothetical protein